MRQYWMCPGCGISLTVEIPADFALITGAECTRCHVPMTGEPLQVVTHDA